MCGVSRNTTRGDEFLHFAESCFCNLESNLDIINTLSNCWDIVLPNKFRKELTNVYEREHFLTSQRRRNISVPHNKKYRTPLETIVEES